MNRMEPGCRRSRTESPPQAGPPRGRPIAYELAACSGTAVQRVNPPARWRGGIAGLRPAFLKNADAKRRLCAFAKRRRSGWGGYYLLRVCLAPHRSLRVRLSAAAVVAAVAGQESTIALVGHALAGRDIARGRVVAGAGPAIVAAARRGRAVQAGRLRKRRRRHAGENDAGDRGHDGALEGR